MNRYGWTIEQALGVVPRSGHDAGVAGIVYLIEQGAAGRDGRSDFNGLHSRRHDAEVEFYAFDMLVSDGEDLRRLPSSVRKTNLARLLGRRLRPEILSSEQALEQAKALARAERDKGAG